MPSPTPALPFKFALPLGAEADFLLDKNFAPLLRGLRTLPDGSLLPPLIKVKQGLCDHLHIDASLPIVDVLEVAEARLLAGKAVVFGRGYFARAVDVWVEMLQQNEMK